MPYPSGSSRAPWRRASWALAATLLAGAVVPGSVSPASAGTKLLAGRTFVIDPGHGTKYPDGSSLNVGAVGIGGLREADVALAVGEDLAAMLRRDGATVVLTRSYAHPYRTGTVLRLDNRARAALANRLNATAFVALHCDADTSHTATGTSVFWLKPNSVGLANVIREDLRPLGLGESQFRARDLAVTNEATVPAVLVEMGFVTNPRQAALLGDGAFQKKIAIQLDAALREVYESR